MSKGGRGELPAVALAIQSAMAALLVMAWGAYRQWGRVLVERLYDPAEPGMFSVPSQIRYQATAEQCFDWGSQLLAALAVGTIALVAAQLALPRQARRLTRALPELALEWGFPVVVAATLFTVYNRIAYEGAFYPIADAVQLKVEPPFRHRVLFVAVAWLCESLVSGITPKQAFNVSQMLAAVLAVLATQAWCRRLASREVACFGTALMGLMLAPTFQYFNFYDFGIVFFYALCLTLLSVRRYGAHVAAVALGTLNHELILFMIPISAVIALTQGMSWRKVLGFLVLQLAAYAAVRGVLFWWLPVERAWLGGKIWINLDFIVHVHYLTGTIVLMGWFAIAILTGFRAASPEQRWSIVLLPMLLAMTLLVGQINEARQFVAFVPVAAGLFVVAIEQRRRPAADITSR